MWKNIRKSIEKHGKSIKERLQHFSSVENDTRNVGHFNEIKLG
jgi:hypothetical protein